MSSGNYTAEMSNLDVSLEADGVEYQLQTVNNGDDFNRVRGVNSKLNNVRLSSYLVDNTYLGGQLHCEAKSGDSRAERLCHRLLDGEELFTTDDGYVAYLLDQKIDASTCDYVGKYWAESAGSCHESEEEACTANGGTYSDICYESEQAACEGNGGTWNGSECCEDSSCQDQAGCEEHGWWWVDGEDGGCFDNEWSACDARGGFRGGHGGQCYDTEEEACTADDLGFWNDENSTCYGDLESFCASNGTYPSFYNNPPYDRGGCYATEEEACTNSAGGGYWSEMNQTCYMYDYEACEGEGGYWNSTNMSCYDTQEESDAADCEFNGGYWDGSTCYWGGEEEACTSNGGYWDGSECSSDDPGMDDDPLLGFLLSHFDPASSSVVFPVTDFAALLGDNASCGGGMCSTKNDIVGEEDCNSIGGSYSDGGCSNFSEGVVCYLLGSQYNTTANYSDGNCVLAVD